MKHRRLIIRFPSGSQIAISTDECSEIAEKYKGTYDEALFKKLNPHLFTELIPPILASLDDTA